MNNYFLKRCHNFGIIIKFLKDTLLFGTQTELGRQRSTVAFNESLHKILMVLIFLCDEMKELKEIAETKFYDTLIMFGSQPSEINPADDSGSGGQLPSGERERMLGKIMPLLQEMSNFIDRCYAVVVNVVQQLSSLMTGYKEGRNLFQSGQPISTPSGTTMRPFYLCFQYLGDILTVLVTLDLIVRQNEMLRES